MNNAAQILDALRTGTVRARALLTAQSDAAIGGIHQFLDETISSMGNVAEGFDVPLPAIIGSGAKA